MPASLGLICLWLDLASDSHRTRSDLNDPLIECGTIRDWLVPYIGGGDAFDPPVPSWWGLSGLPPIVMQSSGAALITTLDCTVPAVPPGDHRRYGAPHRRPIRK